MELKPIRETLKKLDTKKALELIPQTIEEYEPDFNLKREMWIKETIPPRFLLSTFKNYEVDDTNRNAFDACKEYAENYPARHGVNYRSLALFSKGVWGLGKTHLACAIAKTIINKCQFGNPIIYLTEPELLRQIRSTYNKGNDAETEDTLLKKLTTIPMLIIDDVGKEEVADPRFVQRVWYSIINTRYDNLLPIVITTNLSPDEIAHHLGGNRGNEATFDRLYEMFEGKFWEIRGLSHRRKAWNSGK